jgi:phosphatidylserine/phosphatidylglycerophosphate/cardiolipin synthase-like enzyme
MNPRKSLFAIVILAILVGSMQAQQRRAATDIDVYFSPGGGCTDAVVAAIAGAKQNVAIAAYSFTSTPIARAVADAHRRGVEIVVVMDKSQRTEKYTSATFLTNAGVRVLIDETHDAMHSKYMVIDGATVLTGSFNYSRAAEETNAENMLILRRPELAKQYLDNFAKHLAHAKAYEKDGD